MVRGGDTPHDSAMNIEFDGDVLTTNQLDETQPRAQGTPQFLSDCSYADMPTRRSVASTSSPTRGEPGRTDADYPDHDHGGQYGALGSVAPDHRVSW
jgi:hypothetical protein